MDEHLIQLDDQLAAVGRRAAAEQRRIERDRQRLMLIVPKTKRMRASRGFELAEQMRAR